jgi:predicted RecB family nuclease
VEQLAEVDIFTVDNLADACAKDVASQTDLTEDTLKKWIGDAVQRDMTPVNDLPEIGDARGEQLAMIGVFTANDLANASPERIASLTELAEHQVKKWVQEAANQQHRK